MSHSKQVCLKTFIKDLQHFPKPIPNFLISPLADGKFTSRISSAMRQTNLRKGGDRRSKPLLHTKNNNWNDNTYV